MLAYTLSNPNHQHTPVLIQMHVSQAFVCCRFVLTSPFLCSLVRRHFRSRAINGTWVMPSSYSLL